MSTIGILPDGNSPDFHILHFPSFFVRPDRTMKLATLTVPEACGSEDTTGAKVLVVHLVWLVVWNIVFFHILGIIFPTDSYFSEGLKPPTRSGHQLFNGYWGFRYPL
jgi:hypothetical protein